MTISGLGAYFSLCFYGAFGAVLTMMLLDWVQKGRLVVQQSLLHYLIALIGGLGVSAIIAIILIVFLAFGILIFKMW